jgi:predicted HicB family RNase H-like nuclease
MGRPEKPEAQKKTRVVQLRLTEKEHKGLAAKAKAAGVSVSEFLRNCGKD